MVLVLQFEHFHICSPLKELVSTDDLDIKTFIHYNIIYYLSLHHATHALKNIAHMVKMKH